MSEQFYYDQTEADYIAHWGYDWEREQPEQEPEEDDSE